MKYAIGKKFKEMYYKLITVTFKNKLLCTFEKTIDII